MGEHIFHQAAEGSFFNRKRLAAFLPPRPALRTVRSDLLLRPDRFIFLFHRLHASFPFICES